MKTSSRTSRAVTALGCAALARWRRARSRASPRPPSGGRSTPRAPPREPLARRRRADRGAARGRGARRPPRGRGGRTRRRSRARTRCARSAASCPPGWPTTRRSSVAAAGGSLAYPDRADALLDRDDLDPALRRRVELARDADPLRVADARLGEERRAQVGALFNRVIEPLSTLALTGALNPIAASRSALSALLAANQLPTGTPRERQALHALDEWRATHPEHPESAEVAERAEELRERLVRAALRALAARRARGERARRLAGCRAPGRARRADAPRGGRGGDAAPAGRGAARRARGARAAQPRGARARARVADRRAARALRRARARDGDRAVRARSRRARQEYAAAGAPAEQASTLRLLAAFEPLARERPGRLRRGAARACPSPGARPTPPRVRRARCSPTAARNAWDAYRAAQRADRQRGARVDRPGPLRERRDRAQPAAPARVRARRARLRGRGHHLPAARWSSTPARARTSAERCWLAGRALRGALSRRRARRRGARRARARLRAARPVGGGARARARRGASPMPTDIADYRAKVAEQLLAAAEKQQRVDLRLAYLATVLREYGDTPSAAAARTKFVAEKAAASPQRIRLTREFLLEHPPLWAPGALALKPELLDGEKANGEMAEDGVTLLGRNAIEIALVGRDPVVAQGSRRRLRALRRAARGDALREPGHRRARAGGSRRRARRLLRRRRGWAWPTAREPRPAARSEAVFESTREKHGYVRTRESILPVDLVLRGDLTTLGLAAFPRIRMPEATPDALLYERSVAVGAREQLERVQHLDRESGGAHAGADLHEAARDSRSRALAARCRAAPAPCARAGSPPSRAGSGCRSPRRRSSRGSRAGRTARAPGSRASSARGAAAIRCACSR